MSKNNEIKELIANCPTAIHHLKKRMSEELVKSMSDEEAKNVPKDFIDLLTEMVIDDDKLLLIIKNNPHSLMYYFDEKEITLDVYSTSERKFVYKIENALISTPFDNRKDAEKEAIIVGIEILEKVLIDEISNVTVINFEKL
jgi:hypothetical protein